MNELRSLVLWIASIIVTALVIIILAPSVTALVYGVASRLHVLFKIAGL